MCLEGAIALRSPQASMVSYMTHFEASVIQYSIASCSSFISGLDQNLEFKSKFHIVHLRMST